MFSDIFIDNIKYFIYNLSTLVLFGEKNEKDK